MPGFVALHSSEFPQTAESCDAYYHNKLERCGLPVLYGWNKLKEQLGICG